ncbi:hypothetical protein HDU83_007637 [Entophlyctis luteolus]|nr:hypothetical protein HDU83_007637 [Entophlyctis luteolus]
MRAAKIFVKEAAGHGFLEDINQVRVDLYGSLALTGVGHGTPGAVLMGLEGESPELIDAKRIPSRVEAIKSTSVLNLGGKSKITFEYEKHMKFHMAEVLPQHPNGMRITCFDKEGDLIATNEFFSVGGGFVVNDLMRVPPKFLKAPPKPTTVKPVVDAPSAAGSAHSDSKIENVFQMSTKDDHLTTMLPFWDAQSLLEVCERESLTIAEVVFRNELQWREADEVKRRTLSIWNVMDQSIANGVSSQEEFLPGKLRVKRRAPAMYRKLMKGYAEYAGMNLVPKSQKTITASGGTQLGSTGRTKKSELKLAYNNLVHIPKEMKKHLPALDWISMYALAVNEENAAGGKVAAIGMLYKRGASISAAEMGCQGEVGVACSMAAAAFTAVMGGSVLQVENAAEIGMEHNLGLTCDPPEGLVVIPCIERNALAAVKAITAAQLALNGDGTHRVHLDQVISTMRQTGLDMMSKYKETSQGGLAVNVPVC